MRTIELIGMVFITAIWFAVVIPMPCMPPSCGPPDAEPFSASQVLRVYFFYTWPLALAWIVVLAIWVKRVLKSKTRTAG